MLKHSLFALGVLLLSGVAQLSAQQPAGGGGSRSAGPAPSIEDRVGGLRKIDGYFPLYWDEHAGTLLLEIPRFDAEFLFSTGLSAGLGSNDIGLDRGQGGQGRVGDITRFLERPADNAKMLPAAGAPGRADWRRRRGVALEAALLNGSQVISDSPPPAAASLRRRGCSG